MRDISCLHPVCVLVFLIEQRNYCGVADLSRIWKTKSRVGRFHFYLDCFSIRRSGEGRTNLVLALVI